MDKMPSSALRVIADQESLQLFFAIATKNGMGSKDGLQADGVRTGDVSGSSSNRRSSTTLFSVKGNRRY